jgi:predicted anti-sigma-YlaC factor YlaD
VISALLDDEDPGVDPRELNRHLLTCPDCRGWRTAAHEVTRNARLEPARAVTVPSDELVGVVLAHSRPPRRPGSVTWARVGLVAVAAAQAWITEPLLLAGHDHAAPAHVAHEMGAFAMALAVGFVVAAWKPDRAHGMRTLVGAVAVLLVVTAVLDLLHARTDFGDEAPHLLAVVGWLLLVYVAAATPSTTVDPSWSLVPVVRAFTGHRPTVDTMVPERAKALVESTKPGEPGRRRAG